MFSVLLLATLVLLVILSLILLFRTRSADALTKRVCGTISRARSSDKARRTAACVKNLPRVSSASPVRPNSAPKPSAIR